MIGWIGAAVALALAAGIFVLLRNGRVHVALPPSAAGQTQMQGPAFDAAREQAEAAMRQQGGEGVLGWYGDSTNGPLRFAVLAEVVRFRREDPFVAGAAGTFGTQVSSMTIDVSKETNWAIGGVRYQCAPFGGLAVGSATVSGTTCFWNDDVTIGYVLLFDPSLDPRSTTATVHDAVVS
jgi:hypothetical protein